MAINRNSTVKEVVEFLESKGLGGEIKQKLEGNHVYFKPEFCLAKSTFFA